MVALPSRKLDFAVLKLGGEELSQSSKVGVCRHSVNS